MIGQTISHYKIIEKLGEGGMGIVYKAHDTKIDRDVALKFLPSGFETHEAERARFHQEARAAGALNHPNICTIHDIVTQSDPAFVGASAGGQQFIVMEYVDGQTLSELMAKRQLTIDECIGYALQIGDALHEAHSHGVVHRDIKPENVMVNSKDQIKVMDFGLAKLKGSVHLTRSTSTLGTAAYMSPEQARGDETDARTDIWSMGVVLYQMLAGKLPFRGEHPAAMIYSIVHEEYVPILKARPNVPVQLGKVLEKMLTKDVQDRYQHLGEVVRDLRRCLPQRRGGAAPRLFLLKLKRPAVAVPTVLLILGLSWLGYRWITIEGKKSWARTKAIPEIQRLIEEASMSADWSARRVEAFRLAKETEKYIPNDTALNRLYSIRDFSGLMKIMTTPPGAEVYVQEYTSPQSDWEYLGITPLDSIRVPYSYFRWKFTCKGYDTVFAVAPGWRRTLSRGLDTMGSVPHGMARVRGDSLEILATGVRGFLSDYFIDKFEVTNSQYKEFMEAGAYQMPKFWMHEFVKDGKRMSWEEAMRQFVDATGRPGPSTWLAGDYLEGQADFPVSGISWYEAAAYAEFAGKDLPTTDHWDLAAFPVGENATQFFPTMIAPLSNFGTGGPARVGSYPGMNAFGAYDMAGNVREWCWNDTKNGRAIRGGAWNDISYMYGNYSQAPPFDRAPKNGVRCVRYVEREKILDGPFGQRLDWEMRNYTKEKPVSDATFSLYRDQFSYDKTDLNARVEQRDSTSGDWIKEKITFDAVYGGERMKIYIFLPRRSTPPYQTVVYFPGSGQAIFTATSERSQLQFSVYDFVVKSGRAVVYPIYYGTYERNVMGVNIAMHWPTKEYRNQFSELYVKWVKDFRRTVDYLYGRPDIDTARIAYLGFSWGGRMGPVITAIEQRLKASVLYLGGFAATSHPRPEADDLNFAPRVHIPTLLLSGKHDMTFPLESSVKPMFDLLGTSQKDKLHKIFDTDHYIPKNDLIKETLSWYEKYLGPVK